MSAEAEVAPSPRAGGRSLWRRVALAAGPGLIVMLANNDAGSVVTAAQSGATFGYRLLLFQFLVIPALYMIQELTIRLGLGTGLGFGELILNRYGRGWARLAVAVLALSCFGALVTQLSALAGLAAAFGAPIAPPVFAVVVLFAIVATVGGYLSVERVAILLGLFQVAFLIVAWRAGPDLTAMAAQLRQAPLGDPAYLYLLAANIGTSFMPWAIFYQQSATIDKGLRLEDLQGARIETFGGAVICQVLTAAVLIAGAASVAGGAGGQSLSSIGDIAATFTHTLGANVGGLVYALGLLGAILVTSITVCLTVAWNFGEVAGFRHSLEHNPREAPWFYAAFVAMLAAGGAYVVSGVDPVKLSIAVGVANALLLPFVLLLLFLAAQSQLSGRLALNGVYRLVVGLLFAVVSALALYAGLVGTLG